MPDEVRIRFKIDFDDLDLAFVRSGDVFPDRAWSPRSLILPFLATGVLPVIAAIVVFWAPGLSPYVRWFVIGVLLLPAIRFLYCNTQSRLTFDSRLDTSDSRFEISVRPDGWTLSTANTRAEHQWPLIARVVRFEAGFVVIENWAGLVARWLPLTGFESDVAVETFVGMVESHDVKYEDRRAEPPSVSRETVTSPDARPHRQ